MSELAKRIRFILRTLAFEIFILPMALNLNFLSAKDHSSYMDQEELDTPLVSLPQFRIPNVQNPVEFLTHHTSGQSKTHIKIEHGTYTVSLIQGLLLRSNLQRELWLRLIREQPVEIILPRSL